MGDALFSGSSEDAGPWALSAENDPDPQLIDWISTGLRWLSIRLSQIDHLSTDQQRAYELMSEQNGLLQRQLWKAFDEDSRKGSRLATTLEEKGLIEREPTTRNGRRTYLLKPVDGRSPGDSQFKNSSESVPS